MATMSSDRIRMGNDEFILYVRKHTPSERGNVLLGKMIWTWLRDHANGNKIDRDGVHLPDEDNSVTAPPRWTPDQAGGLPKDTTQFEFDRIKLPELFDMLDTL